MRFFTNVSYAWMLFSNLALPTTATDFEINANGKAAPAPSPPSDFELYADRTGGKCPSLKAVTQEECFDAAHEVTIGMKLSDSLNVVNPLDFRPCGCFVSVDPWVDYNWVDYKKDPKRGNCLADRNSNLVCRKEISIASAAWQQLGNDIDGETAGDESGTSVALSQDGTIVAIGARKNDGNGDNSGLVRVYKLTGSAWQQLGTDIDGEAEYDESGGSVALSQDGTTVAIGAPWNDGNGGRNSGHVRVYIWTGSAWQQIGNDIDGEGDGDGFGRSVALSQDGTIVAIGAPSDDGNGSNSGHVRVYKWTTGSAWQQIGNDIDGEAEYNAFGTSVGLSQDGTTVAIGAPWNGGNGRRSGHVRVHKWTGSSWEKLGDDMDGEAAGDDSGSSVALSQDGTTVVIGASYNGGNGNKSGHARVYKWTGSAWQQLGNDIDGEAAGDYSGSSVALSQDGTIVAIGAPYNRGNGNNSGHVRVYVWTGSSWEKLGDDIDGEYAGDDAGLASGSVALSQDGMTVAIGASTNNGNGSDSGHVRVYSLIL